MSVARAHIIERQLVLVSVAAFGDATRFAAVRRYLNDGAHYAALPGATLLLADSLASLDAPSSLALSGVVGVDSRPREYVQHVDLGLSYRVKLLQVRCQAPSWGSSWW